MPCALQADESSMPGETVVSSGAKLPLREKPRLLFMALLGSGAALIVLFGVWLAGALYQAPTLEVETVPPGARLEIDGVEAGRSPVRLATLKAGKHVVMAFAEGKPDQAKT